MKKNWKYGILALLVAGFAITYLVMPKGPARPVLPMPNGYEDLLKAAQPAVSDRHLAFGDASDDELKDLVNRNRVALNLARIGCARECRVTTDYGVAAEVYAAQHLPVLAQFKKLALAFRAEGELAEREGRTKDAARIYLDGIRFAQEMCRGGLLIDRLVGIATERINLDPLRRLELDAATCREAARALEQMEFRREPIEATWTEEKFWTSRVGSLRERIGFQLVRIVRPKVIEAPRQVSASKLAEVQTHTRQVMLQLAARAYEVEHGKYPDPPGQLVPDYLQMLPKHPVNGEVLTFEP